MFVLDSSLTCCANRALMWLLTKLSYLTAALCSEVSDFCHQTLLECSQVAESFWVWRRMLALPALQQLVLWWPWQRKPSGASGEFGFRNPGGIDLKERFWKLLS